MHRLLSTVLLGTVILFSQYSLSSTDCIPRNQIGNADWKNKVLSAEDSIYLLEMELANSISAVTECLDQSSTQDYTASEGEDISDNGGDGDDTAGASIATTESPVYETSPNSRSSVTDVTHTDLESNSDVVVEDNLEQVMREAILTESDVTRRKALKERYRQLFGKEPPA